MTTTRLKLKSVYLEEDLEQAIVELARQSHVRKELAKVRKNAGEGQLIRMIIEAGLPIIQQQFQN